MTQELNPNDSPSETQAKTARMIELLAFTLYVSSELGEMPGEKSIPDNERAEQIEHALIRWQGNRLTRADQRSYVERILRDLAERGIGIKIIDSKKLTAAMTELRTVPPREAYDGDEVKLLEG